MGTAAERGEEKLSRMARPLNEKTPHSGSKVGRAGSNVNGEIGRGTVPPIQTVTREPPRKGGVQTT